MSRPGWIRSILFGAGAVLAMAVTAVHAQAPRSSVDSAATTGVPEFRDPKTGQIWTPLNVGLKGGPDAPADRAFNPSAQTASVPGVVVQKVPVTPLGSVPIVVLESASLRAVPGARWQVTIYLDNNSGNVVSPVVVCNFTNAGKPVESARALLPQIGPGARVGFVVHAPKVELFVDYAHCNVESP